MFLKKIYLAFTIYLFLFFFNVSTVLSSPIKDSKSYDNFSLFDYNNNIHSLKDFAQKKGIVVMFISIQCPVSNAYNNRMAELHKQYGADISFIGINSNKNENIGEIKKHAIDSQLDFIILKDSSNIIADKFEASFTPEVYVLNNDFEQLYHGRIDDSRREDNVESNDLKNALIQLIAGREVSIKKTKAFGCTIKRIK